MTYTSLDELVRKARVILPAPRDTWRLVKDPVCGEITGLPGFRGLSLATNGIFVMLVNELDEVRFGHLEWFQPDASERNAALSDLWDGQPTKTTTTRSSSVAKTLADYIGL